MGSGADPGSGFGLSGYTNSWRRSGAPKVVWVFVAAPSFVPPAIPASLSCSADPGFHLRIEVCFYITEAVPAVCVKDRSG